jgi:hypothetical protein
MTEITQRNPAAKAKMLYSLKEENILWSIGRK